MLAHQRQQSALASPPRVPQREQHGVCPRTPPRTRQGRRRARAAAAPGQSPAPGVRGAGRRNPPRGWRHPPLRHVVGGPAHGCPPPSAHTRPCLPAGARRSVHPHTRPCLPASARRPVHTRADAHRGGLAHCLPGSHARAARSRTLRERPPPTAPVQGVRAPPLTRAAHGRRPVPPTHPPTHARTHGTRRHARAPQRRHGVRVSSPAAPTGGTARRASTTSTPTDITYTADIKHARNSEMMTAPRGDVTHTPVELGKSTPDDDDKMMLLTKKKKKKKNRSRRTNDNDDDPGCEHERPQQSRSARGSPRPAFHSRRSSSLSARNRAAARADAPIQSLACIAAPR